LVFLSISYAGEYTEQVKTQFSLIKLATLSDGWQETHNEKFDKLDDGDYDSFSFRLRQGETYKIVSACDSDCKDLDLTLYDDNNNKISDDMGSDDMPIVEVTPKWTADFTLKVKMYDCKSNPCYYGIAIFSK